MSKTHYSFTVGFTVWDIEDLPDDLSPADVCRKIQDVVAEALATWYADGGDKLVTCEPIC